MSFQNTIIIGNNSNVIRTLDNSNITISNQPNLFALTSSIISDIIFNSGSNLLLLTNYNSNSTLAHIVYIGLNKFSSSTIPKNYLGKSFEDQDISNFSSSIEIIKNGFFINGNFSLKLETAISELVEYNLNAYIYKTSNNLNYILLSTTSILIKGINKIGEIYTGNLSPVSPESELNRILNKGDKLLVIFYLEPKSERYNNGFLCRIKGNIFDKTENLNI
jgi:hypothetical protein